MRCQCCDKNLNDYESTRKSVSTGEYLDMCNKCYSTISDDLLSEVRYDLYDGNEEDDEYTEGDYDEEYN
jgi:hypothetical protein